MIRIFALLLAFVAASPVDALSCMPADIARSYQNAAASEKRYVVLLGTFDFNARNLPKTDWHNQQDTPENTLISVQFSGKSLSADGFTNTFQSPVTVNAQCYGPWCSSLQRNTQTLAFVEKTQDDYLLAINPCGGFAYQKPSQGHIDQVVACHQGRGCKPQDF